MDNPTNVPTGGSGSALRKVVLIIMDLLVVVAIAVTTRLVIQFFGQLDAQSWGKTVVGLTQRLVIPFGVDAIKTPYGGVFGVNEALTIVALLVGEWVLSIIRTRA